MCKGLSINNDVTRGGGSKGGKGGEGEGEIIFSGYQKFY